MLQEFDHRDRGTTTSSQVKMLSPPPLPRIPESIFENLEVDSGRSRDNVSCGWSCCGGIVLILLSFWVLGWNEATNSPRENSLAYAFHNARNASCDYVDEANNGHLVWLSCPVISMPRLAQDAPPAIRAVFSEAALELRGTELEWWAEMLQWTERKLCRGSSSRRNRCLCSYHQDFCYYDVDPADFHCVTKMRSGCSQVAPSERPRSRLAQLGPPEVLHGVVRAPAGSVTIGNPRNGYSLSSALISQINSKAEIQLIDADGAAAFIGVADRQLHIDLTSNQSFAQTFVASPRLGDLRLRVTASTTDFVSVIARQEPGGRLGPYVIPTIRPSEPIEWLASGHHGHLQSLLQHHSRDDVAWLWRFLGILSMWLGTALLLSPLGEAEPSCMALLCVACFAGAVISALLATVGATLFASLPIELLLAVIGVAAAFFVWRSYKAPWFGRAHYYEYYYGDDASSVEMPLVGGREYDGDNWFERRLDNRCIDSDDDEIDKIGAPKDLYLGRQPRPPRQLRHDLRE